MFFGMMKRSSLERWEEDNTKGPHDLVTPPCQEEHPAMQKKENGMGTVKEVILWGAIQAS